MNKKIRLNYAILLIAILLIALGFYSINKNTFRDFTGLIFGVGSGLLGVSASNIFSAFYYKQRPQMEKLKNIEVNDERNKFLRYKTGYQIYKINTYIICVIAILASVLKLPLWIVLSLSGLLLVDLILYILIFNKNNKSN